MRENLARRLPPHGGVALGVVALVLPPATAAEWAAWVQTLGVLLGHRLGGAAAAPGLPGKGLGQAAQVAAMFATNMHWVFRELNDACVKRSWADYAVHRRVLEEILAQGREVTLATAGRPLAGDGDQPAHASPSRRSEITEAHTAAGSWPHLQLLFRPPAAEHRGLAVGNRPSAGKQRADGLCGPAHLLSGPSAGRSAYAARLRNDGAAPHRAP